MGCDKLNLSGIPGVSHDLILYLIRVLRSAWSISSECRTVKHLVIRIEYYRLDKRTNQLFHYYLFCSVVSFGNNRFFILQTPTSGKKKGKGKNAASASQVPATPDNKDKKPPKVKGTPNAYALFYKETYSQLREGNPEWKACQIMAEAGKIWKSMNGQGQDRYRAQAEELTQQHQALHNTKSTSKKQKVRC